MVNIVHPKPFCNCFSVHAKAQKPRMRSVLKVNDARCTINYSYQTIKARKINKINKN